MRLLLAEDDDELAGFVRADLARAGFAVDRAADGVDAEHLGDTEPYDAVVLDLGLPGRPGLDVLRAWRARGNAVPVIVLTARDAWHERVDGFNAGCDDYLGKPFHTEELVARIRALIHRRHGQVAARISSASLIARRGPPARGRARRRGAGADRDRVPDAALHDAQRRDASCRSRRCPSTSTTRPRTATAT